MTGRFGGVATAMVTPFDDEGALDLDGARDLARYLVANGNDGLVVAGTTGESPTLTDDEKLSCGRPSPRRSPSPSSRAPARTTPPTRCTSPKRRRSWAWPACLALCPYYNRPSQAGIEAHLRAVAAATDLPVMIYDIPVRTGRKIATATLLRLAREVPNIVALKDAAGNPAETARVVAEAPAASRCTAATTP